MKFYAKITFLTKIYCTLCVVLLCVAESSAQQTDSIHFSLKPATKKTNKIPEIKANIQPYRPLFGTLGYSGVFNTYSTTTKPTTVSATAKDKLLTIVKIYPNPVEDQLNIILSIGKDATQTTIKIIDLLGNEVVTLANERLNAGEQTKSFSIPSRLNAGIYFLRVVAGSESQVKRISVL